MKRIIDGKRYNTETAQFIGNWEYAEPGNFHHVYEALYRTPSGRYFLEYQGGALSPYAVNNGPHCVSGSRGIRPLDAEEALAWCEDRDIDAEVIEKFFTVEDA